MPSSEASEVKPDDETERFLTTAEAGRRLGFTRDAIRGMCERGRIPGAFRLPPSGHWRIPASAVEALRAGGRPRKRHG